MTEHIDTKALSLIEIEAAYQERLDYVADCLEIGVARIVESINKRLGTNWVPDERRSAEMGTSYLTWGVHDPFIKKSYLDLEFNYEELSMDFGKGFYYNLVLEPSASSSIELGFPMEHLVIDEGQVRIDVITSADDEDTEPVISITKPVSKKFLFGEDAARAVKKRDEKIRRIETVPYDQKSYDAVKNVFTCLPSYEIVEQALLGSTELLLDWYEEVKRLEESPFMNQHQTYPTMTIKGMGEIRFILPFTSRVVLLQRLNEQSTMDLIFPGAGSTKEAMLIIEALRTSECSGQVVEFGGSVLTIREYMPRASKESVLYDVELYNGFGERVNCNNPLSIITEAFPNSKILSRRVETDRDLNAYVEKAMNELIGIIDFNEAITIAKIFKVLKHDNRSLIGCVWVKVPMHKDWATESKFNLAVLVDSELQGVFDASKFKITSH
ncbi:MULTISPECIES: hypothetical protein [unclassified Paenibacillus]|uniref:hypothetical protein n=2 Tax=Paenibacillus TaxID=44249 RepID=UPI0009A6C66B|nr:MULTISPECIES: hypothetical protein [unclassified Paenibacillus]SLK16662.1 hypothetical protein SAMN06272722_110218 [Paenibacillus sp. RU5A]SOC74432.1 hypothetical protein SAMN05880581_110218 [Paenibacillus sp. RU26A]SOC76605.1 hypothetical protein SAMN05880586_110218 [Paenibacillus sp. RU5M]